MQFPEVYQKHVVNSVEGCEEQIIDLLKRSGERKAFSRGEREPVHKHFFPPTDPCKQRLINQLVQ